MLGVAMPQMSSLLARRLGDSKGDIYHSSLSFLNFIILMTTNENNIGKPSICEKEIMMKQRMKELQRECEGIELSEEEEKKEEFTKDSPSNSADRSLKVGDLVYLKDNSNNVTDIKGIVIDSIETNYVQIQLVNFAYKVIAERNKVKII